MEDTSENIQNNVTIAELTLQKLTQSMNQYAASAVSGLNVPEFSGKIEEDVRDFVRRFKLATITLTDEMRCLALEKALHGTAYVWAKNNIKTLLRSGDWKAAKQALVERFQPPNAELKAHEQLSKLKFNPKLGSLQSYIEDYHNCYKKAYKTCEDSAVITQLKLNLPNNVQRSFNVLNDNWTSFSKIKDLLELAKRAEEKILPFEQPDEGNKLDAITLKEILKEFKDSLVSKKDAEPQSVAEKPVENLALIHKDTPNNNNGQKNMTGFAPRRGPYYPYPYRSRNPFRPRSEYRGNYTDQNMNQQRTESGYNPEVPDKDPKSTNKRNENPAYEVYKAKYGEPPSPCDTCSGKHFHRHCPYKMLN